MRRLWRNVAFGTGLALAASAAAASGAPGRIGGEPAGAATPNLSAVRVRLVTMASGLVSPVGIAFRPGDGRMYVIEKRGQVKIVQNRVVVATALSITVSTGGEQGLLGLTFSPDGSKMYASFTDVNGDSRIDEFAVAANGTAVMSSRRQVTFVDQPFANHNGGQVSYGPDGYLYWALGDGGGAGDPQNTAQNLSSYLGKIWRIDPRPIGPYPFRVPSTNPFVGTPGARTVIWMYGLRNPWRFSFDRGTGDMWIGDVGQASWEEVDFAPAGMKGTNWGWSLREGFVAFKGAAPPGARDPILVRSHAGGDCSVIGGYVYRGTRVASLPGAYVFGDFCTGTIRAVVRSGNTIVQNRALGPVVSQLTSFGEGPLGELYAISAGGTVYWMAQA